MDTEYTAGKRFAKGNYAAFASPVHTDLQLVYPGAIISTGQKLKRITDGLSKTAAFSEVRTLDDERDERCGGSRELPGCGSERQHDGRDENDDRSRRLDQHLNR